MVFVVLTMIPLPTLKAENTGLVSYWCEEYQWLTSELQVPVVKPTAVTHLKEMLNFSPLCGELLELGITSGIFKVPCSVPCPMSTVNSGTVPVTIYRNSCRPGFLCEMLK